MDRPIARKDIAEFVRDGSYFDEPVAYEPSTQGELGELTIKYAPNRSIRLRCLDRENNEEIIEEAIESLDSVSILSRVAGATSKTFNWDEDHGRGPS